MEQLYKAIVWPLYKKYSHPIEAFKQSLESPAALGALDCSDRIKQILQTEILRRLSPLNLKIKTEIELTCPGYEGIVAIRKALLAGQA